VSIRTGLVIAVASIGILAAGWSSPAAAQTAACTGNGKISKQIAKQMSAAQDAMKAKKWQDTLAKTREAETVPGSKSAFDTFMMSEFRGYAYHNLRQDSDAARELENGLNSPCLPEAKRLDRLKSLVGLYSALRNFPKVIDYGNRALKLSRDPDMVVAVAQAYYQSGNPKESARLMNDLLSSLEQSGRVPKENQLLLVLGACQKANDKPCQRKVFEKLVSNYPKPEYWQNLTVALTGGENNDIQTLNVMRLSAHVKVMKRPDNYKEYAQLALDEKLSCEAQTVLEEGFTKKVFVDKRDIDVNTRLLNTAKTRCIAEKAAVAPAENAAVQQPTGDALVKAGAQYLTEGNPAKAAEVIQKGITKGTLAKGDVNEAQRVDEANLLLGIAHLKNNNKAEAQKAFKAVKRDPTMVSIAKFWMLSL
jgi:hypothetical protein